MPPELYLVFLLLIAALAFGWFYIKRAKTRTGTPVSRSSADDTDGDSAV